MKAGECKGRRRTVILCAVAFVTTTFFTSVLINVAPVVKIESLKCHHDANFIVDNGEVVCQCKNGYQGDGVHCHDHNECETGEVCGTHGSCVNTNGSFYCDCHTGFHLQNATSCIDINECDFGTSPCDLHAYCKNTPGSYKCACQQGYYGNGHMCTPNPSLCTVGPEPAFPHCKQKVEWLTKFWEHHPCYAEHGVDGTLCTIVHYLSTVEGECPKLKNPPEDILKKRRNIKAELKPLLFNTLNNRRLFGWLADRITFMWDKWVAGYNKMSNSLRTGEHKKKNILLFPGLLADKKWSWADKAGKGGPLGELVQWADLIAGLYLLGHQLFLSVDPKTHSFHPPCKGKKLTLNDFHLIYTDMHGLSMLIEKGRFNMQLYKCKLRVLDSFGTEARFNFLEHVTDREQGLPEDIDPNVIKDLTKNPFGYAGWRLHLKQFLTMFPHSDDNTFLGFIVDTMNKNEEKENKALVYGKEYYMWKSRTKLLSTIYRHDISIHSTVYFKKKEKKAQVKLPGFVENHGLMSYLELQKLLAPTKIFIGLGFPFEGPAPLEAISHGAIFINPKFKKPWNRLNDIEYDEKLFFEGKPTLRKFTSQHMYMEKYIGRPYVYTIDIDNMHEVNSTVTEILKNFEEKKTSPYLPFEFTHAGFLQRLDVLVQKQGFCAADSIWPPGKTLEVIVSTHGQSCTDACFANNLVCDNSLFPFVNSQATFKKSKLTCDSYTGQASFQAPCALKNTTCVLQQQPLAFSCVDSGKFHQRLCPCRRYVTDQIALCPLCT